MSDLTKNFNSHLLAPWVESLDRVLKSYLLPLGLFVQLTGMLWIGSNGGYVTQTYIWCLFPGLLSILIDLYRFGLRSCLRGITTGEKLLATLLLWILVNPFLSTGGDDWGTVFDRVLKISLYIYVARTTVLHMRQPERLLLAAATVATLFAAATMIYQFGVLDRPMGIRALGESGFRIGSLGIGGFAKGLSNPILAALYYGAFASILCGYLAGKPFYLKRRLPAVTAALILFVFILLSGSRGPLIAYMVMCVIALTICRYTWKKNAILLLMAGACIILAILHTEIIKQIEHVFADGFNCRFPAWETAIQNIISSPWLGYGAFSEFSAICRGTTINHPHNMALNISYHWGVVAGVLYLATVLWGLSNISRDNKTYINYMSITLLVFGFVGMLTDTYNFISRPGLQWLLFLLPIALLSGSTRLLQKK